MTPQDLIVLRQDLEHFEKQIHTMKNGMGQQQYGAERQRIMQAVRELRAAIKSMAATMLYDEKEKEHEGE